MKILLISKVNQFQTYEIYKGKDSITNHKAFDPERIRLKVILPL